VDHKDHIDLIRDGVHHPDGVWADLGAGEGAFTLALADLLSPQATVIAVDRDRNALRSLARHVESYAMTSQAPRISTLHADYTQKLDLSLLDGMVMANALHFQKEKLPILQALVRFLKPGGHFILVEYNVDRGNLWVPHPISFATWQKLAQQAGFAGTRLLATRPSRFLNEIYSALSEVQTSTPRF
jgi:ubiquinone/menaquinone biosynthesis C-methylase UbiE